MNELKNKVKNNLAEQKKIYFILMIIMLLGFIFGIIYALILSKSDHSFIQESLTSFFDSIQKNDIHYMKALSNSLVGNVIFVLVLWLLGVSIIGIPIIFIIVFFKTFLFGFSIASIIYTYHFKGILKAITYVFPHQLILLFITLFLSFYAVYFSKKLFTYLFLKKEVSLKHSMKRYSQVFLISLLSVVICSFIEVYVSPALIKLILTF